MDGYDIPTFYEDWHQCKTKHLNKNEDIERIQKQINSQCDKGNRCQIMRRHQRDREKEEFDLNNNEEIDIKNIILNDKLDSIHSFLFHSMQRRRNYVAFGDIDDERKEEQKYDDIWSNEPASIAQCSAHQIVYILEHRIFDNLKEKIKEKLKDHKQSIIEYVKQHQIDGNKLKEMKRKKFMIDIAAHLNSNKLKSALGYLYKETMEFGIKSLYEIDESKATKVKDKTKDQDFVKKNSKFVTEIKQQEKNDEKAQYYSFGTQYRYTSNLREHPLFVQPKYASLKEELHEYLKRINGKDDTAKLSQKQLKIIDSMNPKLQSILKQFVNGDSVINGDVLWDDGDQKYEESLADLIESERKSIEQFNGINNKLFDFYSPDVDENIVFNALLNLKYTKTRNTFNQLIENKSITTEALIMNNTEFELYPMTKKEIEKLVNESFDFSKSFYFDKFLKKKLESCPLLLHEATKWANANVVDEIIKNLKTRSFNEMNDYKNIMIEIFQSDYNSNLYQKIKDEFIKYTTNKIKNAMDENRENYIDYQQQQRCKPFIENAFNILKMDSLKQMKASWYQGLNHVHKIYVGQSVIFDHVLALILYAQCTKLCTKFRYFIN